MKRLPLWIAICVLCVSGIRHAKGEVSIDFFYNALGTGGSWVELADYGYVWQPGLAVSNTNWRPYSDGYWAYTDVGWTWVSYEDFGWATYHYGRWVRLRDRGWFWVPGYEWAPAWVSWRTGNDYVGWAPLPPEVRDDLIYEGRPVYGDVDIAYDIGPFYYNFVDVRYMGEPVLRERIFDPVQNVTYVDRTVNVTNITYRDNAVYNYGPDYSVVSAYSARPIQRLALQRETNADVSAIAQAGGLMKVQGDKLIVAAPPRLAKAAGPAAPKLVKEKIGTATVERGWSGIPDQRTVAQLKEKMRRENPKNVPPPDITPRPGISKAPITAGSPANTAPAGTSATSAVPGMGPSPATVAAPSMPARPAAGEARGQGKPGIQAAPVVGPIGGSRNSESVAPGMAPAVAPGKSKTKARGRHAQPETAPPVTSAKSERRQVQGRQTRELETRPAEAAQRNAARVNVPPRTDFSAGGQGRRQRAAPAAVAGPPPGPRGGGEPHSDKGGKQKKGSPHEPPPGQ